ncbi:MAG: hypothetical protein JXB39_04520 [Deltaproteobacteria bacterium]|nr:hypothetical protein [Deltaproteobacteria bacterium]
MPFPLLPALLLPGIALATDGVPEDPAPPEVSATEAERAPAGLLRASADATSAAAWYPVLELSSDLEASGEVDGARATLDWLLDQPEAAPLHPRAAALRDALPWGQERTGAAVRLALWQGALGTWVLGPNMAFHEWYGELDVLYPLGALAGAGLGVSTALLAARSPDFGPASAATIVAAQQILTFDGAMLLGNLGDYRGDGVPLGILAGAGAGTAAGWWLASRSPDPALPVATRSGAWWGLGLALAGLSYTYAWDDDDFDPTLPLLAAVNGGAAGGYALARFAGLSQAQVRSANLGALLGAGSSFAFAWFTSDVIWYTEHQVAAIVAASGVAGGVAGALLAGRMDRDAPVGAALVHGQGRDLAAGLPLPTPRPSADGLCWDASLVDYRF